MQIHELDTFIGTTSDSTYLAIDDGTETNKIPATDLGITTEMTQAEAEAGTETALRVISPAILNSVVNALAQSIAQSVAQGVVSEFIAFDNFTKNSNVISASSTASVTIDITKAGYTPIGIIRIQKSGTAQADVALNRFQISGNEAQIGLLNTKNTERTVNIGITVLYQKSES